MVLDYKGVSFSFKDRKKAKRSKQVRLLLLAVILVTVIFMVLRFIDSGKIGNVQDLLLNGQQDEARSRIAAIKDDWFHGEAKKELDALVHLYFKDFGPAQKILDSLKAPASEVRSGDFLDYFSRQAAYGALAIYTEFLSAHADQSPVGDRLLFYKAIYNSALLNDKRSAEALQKMPKPLKEKYKKALALIKKNNKQVQAGQVKYIFDTNGVPVGYFDVKTKQTVSNIPGITFDAFNAEFLKGFSYYGLTLDRRIQVLLHRLFQNKYGSFLLMNVADSNILAAYSKPRGDTAGNGASIGENAVFTELYEPGSIVKLLTLLAFLNQPPAAEQSDQKLFPFQCHGYWQLEGKTFYDWTTHKTVENLDEALAVSCNLAFAKMGIEIGYQGLNAFFTRFYFNKDTINDRFLPFKTGKTSDVMASQYRLGKMAVGLDVVTITTFHAAYIATIISQNGSAYPPVLIKTKRNLLDIPYDIKEPVLQEVLKDNTAFFKVKNAMVYVVEAPDGTGRRSRVEDLPVALKTGTAGDKRKGLDAILTGFFPADKPQYAFAFRLQGVGKAEWEGALFLKRFLTSFYRTQSGSR